MTNLLTGTPAAISAPTCPTCGAVIRLQAIVGGWLDQPEWDFWGTQGNRWKRCEGTQRGYAYTHFICGTGAQQSHRLAWCHTGD